MRVIDHAETLVNERYAPFEMDSIGRSALYVCKGACFQAQAMEGGFNANSSDATAALERAVREYQNASELSQNVEQISWLANGFLLVAKGDFDTATHHFDAALDLTQNASLYALLGKAQCLFAGGNYEAAFHNYAEALKLHGSRCPVSVRVGLGNCFFRMGRMDKAKQAYLRTLSLIRKMLRRW